MNRKTWKIGRRELLRGAGASIALPLLDAMLPSARGEAAKAKPPVRMACLFFPNGVWQPAWIPKTTGKDYELPFSLEPLASVKKDVAVLSGLDKAHSRSGDGHYAKTANFLTGLHVEKTTGKNINSGGISVDQLAAKHIGHRTPLASLELAIDPVISGIDSLVGFTRLYGSYISWQSAKQPMSREIHPRSVYERMFGARDAKGRRTKNARRVSDDQSLLDLALEDARRLRGRLGRDDQIKIDEYLDSVRAVERRLEFFSQPDARTWKPPTSPKSSPPPEEKPHDFREHIRLMLDMMVLAFWTDSTRISTFMFANDVSGRNFSFLDGVSGGHHQLSHHDSKKHNIEQYKRINRWHVEQYAYFIARLKAIREGETTLLDNSMVLVGCGMSDGNRHDPNNLPLLVAGRGGGALQTGQHVASPKNTPLSNLYVSMLNTMGVPTKEFGDSTGPLKGLMAAPV